MVMKTLSKLAKVIMMIILAATSILYIYALCGNTRKGEPYIGEFTTYQLNDHWTMENATGTSQISLPYALDEKQDTTAILRNTLPADIHDGMSLRCRASMQDVVVKIDGKERGSHRTSNYSHMQKKLPSAYIVVDLTEADASKEIEIDIVSKKSAHGKYNEVIYGYGQNVWFLAIQQNLLIALMSALVIITGIATLFAWFLLKKKLNSNSELLYLSGMMMVAGMWIISESKLRQLIFHSPSYSSVFSYILISIMAAFAAQYFDNVQRRRYTKAYSIITIIIVTQVVINMILDTCEIAEYYDTLRYSHFWSFLVIVITIITLIKDIKTKKVKEYVFTSIGMILTAGCAIAELISFYFIDFYIIGAWLELGLFFMLISTLIQSFVDAIGSVEKRRIESINQTKSTIKSIAKTIDAKDKYTGGHSERVGAYAKILCKEVADSYGFTEADIERIYFIGNLHDIGKIGIPDRILNKEGRLTDDEYRIMKSHTEIGYQILESIDDVKGLKEGVRSHHERYDGKGYPDGLKGEEIPLVARILCLVDCYDAMTSDRVYRKRLSDEAVYNEIKKCAGTQFDPKLAKVMLSILDEGKMSM